MDDIDRAITSTRVTTDPGPNIFGSTEEERWEISQTAAD
jgi:hypothetical protein